MTADGWRCPECGLILAPSVTEHRCDPPATGVPAIKPRPDEPPDITEMGLRQIREGIHSIDETRAAADRMPSWTVNTSVSLSAEQITELTQAIQRRLLQQAKRNPPFRRLA